MIDWRASAMVLLFIIFYTKTTFAQTQPPNWHIVSSALPGKVFGTFDTEVDCEKTRQGTLFYMEKRFESAVSALKNNSPFTTETDSQREDERQSYFNAQHANGALKAMQLSYCDEF